MAINPPLPQLSELAPAFLPDSGVSREEQGRRQCEFGNALSDSFSRIGIRRTIKQLNRTGHALQFVKEADGGWLIYREPLPDGKHDLQISCMQDGSELMLTTPMTDAAWEQMLKDRRRNLPPEQQADEQLRDRFYALGGELHCSSDPELKGSPISHQLLHSIYLLEMEINNGGFAQYFSNTGGQWADRTIAYLEEIGATHTAAMLKRAAILIGPPFDSELTDRQWAALDSSASGLSKLDDEFDSSGEDPALLAMQWILRTDPTFPNHSG